MAINHIGYLDFTFAGLAADPAGRLVRFMAKTQVFDHRVSGPPASHTSAWVVGIHSGVAPSEGATRSAPEASSTMSAAVDCWVKPLGNPSLAVAFEVHTDRIEVGWTSRTQITLVGGR